MKSRLVIILCVTSFITTMCAQTLYGQSEKTTNAEPGAQLAQNMITRLEKAKLSESQIAAIQKLAAEFGPRAWQIRKPANITPEQRTAMAEARKQGSDAGKSGAELTKFVHAAANLNDEQITALKAAGKVYREFQREAFDLLSNRQRKRVGITTESKMRAREKKKDTPLPVTSIRPASRI